MARYWKDRAVDAYWAAYERAIDADLKAKVSPTFGFNKVAAFEAGQNYARLVKERGPTADEAKRLDRIAADLKKMADFPGGWNEPAVVLRDDIFEASHTYRLKGLNKFLTVVEAQDGGRRYYKAYLADRLDGEWKPLATTKEKPFAGPINVRDSGPHWTDSFSHGELLRDGFDQNLEVDPVNLRFLFQGVTDEAKRGKAYGDIPWRLGILEPADQQPSMKHR